MILVNRSTRLHEQVDRSHWATRHVQAVNRTVRPLGIRLCGHCRQFFPFADFRASSCCYRCNGRRTRRWEQSNRARSKIGQSIRSARRRALEREQSVPGAPVTWQKLAEKWAYWGGLCHLCRAKIDPDTVNWDHVIPISRPGGRGLNIVANLRPSHPTCNFRKGSR